MQAKKEMDALENYRSETNQTIKPLFVSNTSGGGRHNTVIRSMDCRVKQIRPGASQNPLLRGYIPDVAHTSQDSMQGGFIVAGLPPTTLAEDNVLVASAEVGTRNNNMEDAQIMLPYYSSVTHLANNDTENI